MLVLLKIKYFDFQIISIYFNILNWLLFSNVGINVKIVFESFFLQLLTPKEG